MITAGLPRDADAAFKIAAKAAIELSAEAAFEAFSDTQAIAQKAAKAGIALRQIDKAGWDVEGRIAGRMRRGELRIIDAKKPDRIVVSVTSPKINGLVKLSFQAKDSDLCNVRVMVSLNPRTLSARLLLHGLKLTKHRQKRRLARGLRAACRHLEAVHSVKG